MSSGVWKPCFASLDNASCDQVHDCTCTPAVVSRYQKRIFGPLPDCIDIRVEVPRVEHERLSDDRLGKPSTAMRQQVEAAREGTPRSFSRRRAACGTAR